MDLSTIAIALRKVFRAKEKLGTVFLIPVLQLQSGSIASRKPCLNL